MPDAASGPEPKSRLGSTGGVALIFSAFVAFNTMITSCASDRASRDAALLQQVGQREQFWTQAIEDLDDILKDKAGASENGDGWMARCRLLAVRTAPFSVEQDKYKADIDRKIGRRQSTEVIEMQNRVSDLQGAFAEQIRNQELVGPECAELFDTYWARAADKSVGKDAAGIGPAFAAKETPKKAEQEAGDLSASAPALPFPRRDLVELSGLSKTGWDIDLFWCERRPVGDDRQTVLTADLDSDRNFAEALGLGQKLAARANANEPLGGQKIGRVRVRILPETLQSNEKYDGLSGGLYLMSDSDAETALANRIWELDKRLTVQRKDALIGQPKTDWYVSGFFCLAGTAAQKLTASDSAAHADASAATAAH